MDASFQKSILTLYGIFQVQINVRPIVHREDGSHHKKASQGCKKAGHRSASRDARQEYYQTNQSGRLKNKSIQITDARQYRFQIT
jgi:hypothetical protein